MPGRPTTTHTGSSGEARGRTSDPPRKRKVTFDDAPAPQGSAQIAAKLMRQRQRAFVRSTLVRAERLDPKGPGFCAEAVRSEAGRRPISAKVREYVAAPLVPERGLGQRGICSPATPEPAHEETPEVEDQQLNEQQQSPRPLSSRSVRRELPDARAAVFTDPTEGSDVAPLPDHVRGLVSLYQRQEDYAPEEERDSFFEELATGWGTGVNSEKVLGAELKRLRTGEDAISFFAKYGDQADVKVLYCLKAEVTERNFRPYDLVVVNEKDRGHEFFMISSKGIVHICPGRPSEHTQLSEWMHQAMMFNMLVSISFFRHYLANKVFGLWRANARYSSYATLRSRLSRNLFFAKPAYVNPLVRIHSLLQGLASLRFIAFQHEVGGRAIELKPFMAQQRELASSTELERCALAVKAVVDEVLDSVGAAARQHQVADRPGQAEEQPRFVHARRKQLELLAYRRRLRQFNLSLFGLFVRLVDAMLQSALVCFMVCQAVELWEKLKKTPKVFTVSVAFDSEGDALEFMPNEEDFQEGFREILQQLMGLVGSVAPLVGCRQYESYTSGCEQPCTTLVVKNDRTFQCMEEAIREIVSLDFGKAQRHAEQYYTPYKTIYSFGQTWSQQEAEAAYMTDGELVEKMVMMRQFEDDLDKLKSVHHFGFLLIESRTLRASLAPTIESGLLAFKTKYRRAAKERCRHASDLLDNANRELQARPSRLEAFMEFKNTLNKAWQQKDSLEELRAGVEDMYSVMRQYQIQISLDEDVKRDALNQAAHQFVTRALPGAEAFVADSIQPITDEIMRRIGLLEAECSTLMQELLSGEFSKPSNIERAPTMLERIDETMERLEEMGKSFPRFNNWLWILGKTAQTSASLASVSEEAARRMVLWEFVSQWNDETAGWKCQGVGYLDMERLRLRLLSFERALASIAKAAEGDPVVAELEHQASEWRSMEPLLANLANRAMRPRHWAKVPELPDGSDLPATTTVKALLAMDAFDNHELLQRCAAVSSQASVESGLQSTYDRIDESWKTRDLPIARLAEATSAAVIGQQATTPHLFILGDCAQLLELLEADIMSLSLLQSSALVWPELARSAADVGDKLHQLRDLLHVCSEVQARLLSLRDLFGEALATSVPIRCDLDSARDDVRKAEKDWRQMMHKARLPQDRKCLSLVLSPEWQQSLVSISRSLGHAAKTVVSYIKSRREHCPRLYFLDDDLLLKTAQEAVRSGATNAVGQIGPMLFPGVAVISAVNYAQDREPEDALRPIPSDSDFGDEDQQPTRRSSDVTMGKAVCMTLTSAEGERFALTLSALEMRGAFDEDAACVVDKLVGGIEESMRFSLQAAVQSAVIEVFSAAGRVEAIHAWFGAQDAYTDRSRPAQSLLLAFMVHWTHMVDCVLSQAEADEGIDAEGDPAKPREEILGAAGMVELLEAISLRSTENIIELSGILRSVRLSNAQRAAWAATLVQELAARNITSALARQVVADGGGLQRGSFEWQRQFRAVWHIDDMWEELLVNRQPSDTGRAHVKVLDWVAEYGCEYVGCAPRFVATPETDRSLLGLVVALRPWCPAAGVAITSEGGSGSAEIVRDLSRRAATPLMEVAGPEALGVEGLERVFRGIMATGAWGLFAGGTWDVAAAGGAAMASARHAVFALLAECLQAVLRCRAGGALEVEVGGQATAIAVPPGCAPGMYFLLNRGAAPCDERPPLDVARWPARLVVLLRPLVIVAPCAAMVVETLLRAEGFAEEDAAKCGRKAAALLRLATGQLLASAHRGVGLRNLAKAVRRAGDRLRQQPLNAQGHGLDLAGGREDAKQASTVGSSAVFGAALQEVCDSFAPGLVADLFPELPLSGSGDEAPLRGARHAPDLAGAIKAVLHQEHGLPHDCAASTALVAKGLEIYGCACEGRAVVVTGAACSGKSSLLGAVAAATQLAAADADPSEGRCTMGLVRLYPDAFPRDELFSARPQDDNVSMPLPGECASPLLSVIESLQGRQTCCWRRPHGRSHDQGGQGPRSSLESLSSEHCASPHRSFKVSALSTPALQRAELPRSLLALDAEVDGPAWADTFCAALGAETPRVLGLMGGARVTLPPGIALAFETRSLAGASPAFCARCAICPLDDTLHIADLVSAFEGRMLLRGALDKEWVPWLGAWATRLLLPQPPAACGVCEGPALARAERFLRLTEALVGEFATLPDVAVEARQELVALWAVYAAAWALGGDLDEAGREQLGAALLEAAAAGDLFATSTLAGPKGKERGGVLDVPPEAPGVARDVSMFAAAAGALREVLRSPRDLWSFQVCARAGRARCVLVGDCLEAVAELHDEAPHAGAHFVATEEFESIRHFCLLVSAPCHSVLLCGEPCSGKSASVAAILHATSRVDRGGGLFRCRQGSTSRAFAAFLSKRMGGPRRQKVLWPSLGGRSCIFVDDVHLASPCLPELVRQLVDAPALWDQRHRRFQAVEGLQLVAVAPSRKMFPPVSERVSGALLAEDVSHGDVARASRWLRHPHKLMLQAPSVGSLERICSHLLSSWCGAQFTEALSATVQSISRLLAELPVHFRPQPSRPLARCALTDVVQWCTAVRQAVVDGPEGLRRLARHEAEKQFGDRLNSDCDQAALAGLLEAAGFSCGRSDETVYMALPANPCSEDVKEAIRYMELGSPSDARALLSEELERLDERVGLPLVLTEGMVGKVSSIARAFMLVGSGRVGGTLLLGPTGCGKRSCSEMAARLLYADEVLPHPVSNEAELVDELVRSAAEVAEGTSLTVFGPISEAWLVGDDSFLMELDSMLREANGTLSMDGPGDGVPVPQVDALHMASLLRATRLLELGTEATAAREEVPQRGLRQRSSYRRASFLSPARPAPAADLLEPHNHSRRSTSEAPEEPQQPAQASRSRFVVVLCLNPSLDHQRFRRRLRKYPGLASHLGAVWLQAWSQEALVDVAKAVLSASPLSPSPRMSIPAELIPKLADVAACLPAAVADLAKDAAGGITAARASAAFVASVTSFRTCLEAALEARAPDRQKLQDACARLQDELSVCLRTQAMDDLLAEAGRRPIAMRRRSGEADDDLKEIRKQYGYCESKVKALRNQVDAHVGTEKMQYDAAVALISSFESEKLIHITITGKISARLQHLVSVALVMLDLEGLVTREFMLDDPIGKMKMLDPEELSRDKDRLQRAEEMLNPGGGQAQASGDPFDTACCEAFGQWTKAALMYSAALAIQSGRLEQIRMYETEKEAIERRIEEKIGVGEVASRLKAAAEVFIPRWQSALAALQEDSRETQGLPGQLLLCAFQAHYAGPLGMDARQNLWDAWLTICASKGLLASQIPPEAKDLVRFGVLGASSVPEGACVPDAGVANRAVVVARAHPLVAPSAELCFCSRLTPLLLDPADIARPWLLAHLKETSDVVAVTVRAGSSPDEMVDSLQDAVQRNGPAVIDIGDGLMPCALDMVLRDRVPDIPVSKLQIFLICKSKEPPLAATHPCVTLVNCDPLSGGNLEEWCFDEVVGHDAPDVAEELRTARSARNAASATRVSFEMELVKTLLGQSDAEAEGVDTEAVLNLLAVCRRACDAVCDERSKIDEADATLAKAGGWRPAAAAVAAFYLAGACAEKWCAAYDLIGPRFRRWLRQLLADAKGGPGAALASADGFEKFAQPAGISFITAMAPEVFPRHRLPLACLTAMYLNEKSGGMSAASVCRLLLHEACDSEHEGPDAAALGAERPPAWMDALSWERLCAVVRSCPRLSAALAGQRPEAWAPWARDPTPAAQPDGSVRVGFRAMPEVRLILPDMDDGVVATDELLLVCAVAPVLAAPMLRRFTSVVLGEDADAAIADTCAPRDLLIAALQKASLPKVLIVLTENYPGEDLRCSVEPWLRQLTQSRGIDFNAVSVAQDDGLMRAATAVATARTQGGWTLVMDSGTPQSPRDVAATNLIASEDGNSPWVRPVSIWALVDAVLEEQRHVQGGRPTDFSSFMLVVSLHLDVSSGRMQRGWPLPRATLADAMRVAVAPPIGLRAQLQSALAELKDHYVGPHAACAVASCVMLGYRAQLGSLGWSLSYSWVLPDHVCVANVLKFDALSTISHQLREAVCFLGWGARMASAADRRSLEALAPLVFESTGPLEAWRPLVDVVLFEDLRSARDPTALGEFISEAFPLDDAYGGAFFSLAAAGLAGGAGDQSKSLEGAKATAAAEGWVLPPDGQARQLLDLLRVTWLGGDAAENFARACGDDEASAVLEVIDLLASDIAKMGPWSWEDPNSTADGAECVQAMRAAEAEIHGMACREVERFSRWVMAAQGCLLRVREKLLGMACFEDTADEEVYESLARREVPASWGRLGGGLLDCGGQPLASWTAEMVGRNGFMRRLHVGIYPSSYWLGGFFRPGDLLVALLRRGARRMALPIEELSIAVNATSISAPQKPWDSNVQTTTALLEEELSIAVNATSISAPQKPWDSNVQTTTALLEEEGGSAVNRDRLDTGIFVHGLAMLAADWCEGASEHTGNFGYLCDCPPGILPRWLPLLQLTPRHTLSDDDGASSSATCGARRLSDSTADGDANVEPDGDANVEPTERAPPDTEAGLRPRFFECPIYRRVRRGGAPLATLALRCLEDPSIWARRGTALVCELGALGGHAKELLL